VLHPALTPRVRFLCQHKESDTLGPAGARGARRRRPRL